MVRGETRKQPSVGTMHLFCREIPTRFVGRTRQNTEKKNKYFWNIDLHWIGVHLRILVLKTEKRTKKTVAKKKSPSPFFPGFSAHKFGSPRGPTNYDRVADIMSQMTQKRLATLRNKNWFLDMVRHCLFDQYESSPLKGVTSCPALKLQNAPNDKLKEFCGLFSLALKGSSWHSSQQLSW